MGTKPVKGASLDGRQRVERYRAFRYLIQRVERHDEHVARPLRMGEE